MTTIGPHLIWSVFYKRRSHWNQCNSGLESNFYFPVRVIIPSVHKIKYNFALKMVWSNLLQHLHLLFKASEWFSQGTQSPHLQQYSALCVVAKNVFCAICKQKPFIEAHTCQHVSSACKIVFMRRKLQAKIKMELTLLMHAEYFLAGLVDFWFWFLCFF